MDTNQQAQVDPEEEQAKKNQLLEIYKLHAQLANDMANRLTTINRFYPTLIFGSLTVFFAFLRYHDISIFEEIDKNEIIGYALGFIGGFGGMLSMTWRMSVKYYHQMLSDKYTVLLKLEENLEFPFFEREWGREWGREEDIPYVRLSVFETSVPSTLFVIFCGLMLGGMGFMTKKILRFIL